jgi:preprotein translocase subunit SecY
MFSYCLNSIRDSSNGSLVKGITNILYYLLLIGFNYFYTIIFWDPEKISEQLRKASVSILDITPGKATVSYLENVVKSTSIIGGLFLCFILYIYDFVKEILNGYLLNQINISSLIILVGVIYELQKAIRVLYKKNY